MKIKGAIEDLKFLNVKKEKGIKRNDHKNSRYS